MKHSTPHIAVVGAGLSGSMVSKRLLEAGFQVSVFDKSRGTGGRLANCRLGAYTVDMGAPYISASTDAFRFWLEKQSEITSWEPVSRDFSGQGLSNNRFYAGTPKLSALTRKLMEGADFISQQRVGYIWPEQEYDGSGVILRDTSGKAIGHYDAAIIATPAKQAVPLLEAVPRFMKKAESAAVTSSWVYIFATSFEKPVDTELFCGEHHLLRRAVKDSSKPGRKASSGSEVWVLEATETWSQQHIDSSPDEVAQAMREAFFKLIGESTYIHSERLHRWLYSRHPSSENMLLWDTDSRIGVCGDWLGEGEAEGAWHSANDLAEQVIDFFTTTDAIKPGTVSTLPKSGTDPLPHHRHSS